MQWGMVVHVAHFTCPCYCKGAVINGSSFYPSLQCQEMLSIGSPLKFGTCIWITTFLYIELLLMTLLLHAIQQDVANWCFAYLSNLHIPAHCSSFVAQIIPVITHCIHIRSSYIRYLWEMMHFSTTCCEPSVLDHVGIWITTSLCTKLL